MIPNTAQPEMQNLVGMWGPPSAIWNLGPSITPYAGEPVWVLQNMRSVGPQWHMIPEYENQLPSLGLQNLIAGTSNGQKLANKA